MSGLSAQESAAVAGVRLNREGRLISVKAKKTSGEMQRRLNSSFDLLRCHLIMVQIKRYSWLGYDRCWVRAGHAIDQDLTIHQI
jgi:hypothetical protein